MEKSATLPYVLSDLDGTIADSSLLVSNPTKEDILRYQKSSGGRFSLITGRLMGATKFLAQELNITLPIISCNGALISDWRTEEVFYVRYLNPKIVTDIILEASQNGIEPIVYTTKSLVGLAHNHRIMMWKKYTNKLPLQLRCGIIEYENISAFVHALKQGTIKPVQLVLYAPQEASQKVAHKIVGQYRNVIEVTTSFAHVFNITAANVDKLSGLKVFANQLKINYQDIVVFGDSYNDLSMLKGVKRGFVVENGVAEAKKVAYKVIPSMMDNGVGKTLKQLIEVGDYD